MAVVFINPNSTVSMTSAMTEQARRAAPDVLFDGWTSHRGPAAIQGVEDGEAAVPPMLELVKEASDIGAEGIVIGCFDDTGLAEAKRLAACPVIGIGQAAYHFAALQGWRFSVVTTLSVSVPILEDNIRAQGLEHVLSRVRASDVPVLELEANPKHAGQVVAREPADAEANDHIGALILGCAGMVEVFAAVRQAVTVEVIDPVSCAARAMRWLAKG